jgi:hypothetical protein
VKLALGRPEFKLFQIIVETNPHVFDTSGKSPVFIGYPNKIDYSKALAAAGGARVTVTKSTAKEQAFNSVPADDIEEEAHKVVYKDQIQHLRGFVKLIKSGATNLLMLTGPGGTGKTWNLESEMQAAGLEDGLGYFKTVGAGSASATYETLYNHRNEIILFDECDTLMNDSEVRAMIKASTDSGKIRKVSFNKKGLNYYDPATQAEPDEEGQLPRYFEFKGGIILVANVSLNKLDPDGAIRTRGFTMEINPTNEEMLDAISGLVQKMELPEGLTLSAKMRTEVFQFIKEHGGKKNRINLRTLNNALKVCAAYDGEDGWQEMVKHYSA